MKYYYSREEFERSRGILPEEALAVFEAVKEVFPMIVSANLTQNTYNLIKHDGFLADDIAASGKFDDLIDYGVDNIHPNYQQIFLDCFSREKLMHNYTSGKTEVYAELYQKGRDKEYQWVSTHAIRIIDKNGDICQICINRILEGIYRADNIRRR